MTPDQKRAARHALGLPNDKKCSYRNRYMTYAGAPVWERLVAAGHAYRDGDFYHLTRAGAELALETGERLDPEDFDQ